MRSGQYLVGKSLTVIVALPPPPPHKTLCPDGVNSAFNTQCCSWFAVRDALVSDVFEGICGEAAHSTVRIAFHDAIVCAALRQSFYL